MGDTVRALLAKNQNRLIKRDNLQQNAIDTGKVMRAGLDSIAAEHPRWVSNVRGMSTFLAFDCETEADKNTLVKALRQNGVSQNGCGDRGMRLRPSLYFQERHANQYMEILDKTCRQLSA
jgi:4-aminobutyrate aminotransferase/(S)-3-amino-2-methylpropionate transaminase